MTTTAAAAPVTVERQRQVPRALPDAAVAVVLLLVYLRTLLRSTGTAVSMDTPKFDYLGRVLGTAHEPGYPLYTLLDGVVVRVLPIGSVAWRVNLLSALFAAAACVLVAKVLRELDVPPLLAAGCAVAIGLTRELWREAVVAEVYALNLLFIMAVLTCLLRYDRTRREGWLVAALALYALSFSHHTSRILLLPGLLVYVVVRRAVFLFRPRHLAVLAGSCLTTLTLYGYLYWRSTHPGTKYVEVRVVDWPTFYAVVTGKRFGHLMLSVPWDVLLHDRLPEAGHQLLLQLGVLAVLVVVGLAALARSRPLVTAVLALWLVVETLFPLTYGIDDWTTMLVPTYLLTGLLTAVGLSYVLTRLRAGATGTAVVAVLLPLVALVVNFRAADQSGDRSQAVVDAALRAAPPHSLVFTEDFAAVHQFNYGLWVDHVGDGRDVHPEKGAIYAIVPDQEVYRIRQYCDAQGSWLESPLQAKRRRYPVGMRTLVFGTSYAAKVAARGFATAPLAGQLYAVTCPPSTRAGATG